MSTLPMTDTIACKGAGHDKGGVTSCAPKVVQAPRSQDNDGMAIWEHKAIHQRLDVLNLDTWETHELLHFNLVCRRHKRPEAKIMMPWPTGNTKRSTSSLMFSTLTPGKLTSSCISISSSKRPSCRQLHCSLYISCIPTQRSCDIQ